MTSSFQQTVVVVALVILVICLIVIGISLYNNKYEGIYPPVASQCPDYYVDVGESGSAKCSPPSSIDLGITSASSCTGTIDFSQSPYTGANGTCAKQQWANTCGITWDGVTNNAEACSS
tara:strand:+ start:236 stop:592 length:357 start_codon:yes stop_codon:yes gene_type:complete